MGCHVLNLTVPVFRPKSLLLSPLKKRSFPWMQIVMFCCFWWIVFLPPGQSMNWLKFHWTGIIERAVKESKDVRNVSSVQLLLCFVALAGLPLIALQSLQRYLVWDGHATHVRIGNLSASLHAQKASKNSENCSIVAATLIHEKRPKNWRILIWSCNQSLKLNELKQFTSTSLRIYSWKLKKHNWNGKKHESGASSIHFVTTKAIAIATWIFHGSTAMLWVGLCWRGSDEDFWTGTNSATKLAGSHEHWDKLPRILLQICAATLWEHNLQRIIWRQKNSALDRVKMNREWSEREWQSVISGWGWMKMDERCSHSSVILRVLKCHSHVVCHFLWIAWAPEGLKGFQCSMHYFAWQALGKWHAQKDQRTTKVEGFMKTTLPDSRCQLEEDGNESGTSNFEGKIW